MLQRLQDHHGWMLALLKEGDPLLRDPQLRPSAAFLATRRSAMGRLLTSYQQFIHREVFDPIIAGGNARDAALARAMKIDCIELTESFRAFQRRWIAEDAVERWDEYHPAAVRMVERLQRHIADVAAMAREVSLPQPPAPVIGTDLPPGV
ncbi:MULTISPECIES: hypothetical protein [Sphingomonas]|uniref:hypothetical protein n=1 Tax=Sphingomonas TaxID=13687 RepID=UPI000F7F30FC|nr:hypothetical protein [Sphingomonas sp. ABOLF]RSV16662.1 hypothetical protein CA235_04250 [Sphingomonas sp. ABOLF]GLK19437.1 hypothetical protein GCM10017606_02630 [Microbacterium terregens]